MSKYIVGEDKHNDAYLIYDTDQKCVDKVDKEQLIDLVNGDEIRGIRFAKDGKSLKMKTPYKYNKVLIHNNEVVSDCKLTAVYVRESKGCLYEFGCIDVKGNITWVTQGQLDYMYDNDLINCVAFKSADRLKCYEYMESNDTYDDNSNIDTDIPDRCSGIENRLGNLITNAKSGDKLELTLSDFNKLNIVNVGIVDSSMDLSKVVRMIYIKNSNINDDIVWALAKSDNESRDVEVQILNRYESFRNNGIIEERLKRDYRDRKNDGVYLEV